MINLDGASVKTQDLTLLVGKSKTLHWRSVGELRSLHWLRVGESRILQYNDAANVSASEGSNQAKLPSRPQSASLALCLQLMVSDTVYVCAGPVYFSDQ